MTAIPSSLTSTKHIVKNQFITYQTNTVTKTSGYSGGKFLFRHYPILAVISRTYCKIRPPQNRIAQENIYVNMDSSEIFSYFIIMIMKMYAACTH